MSARTLLLSLLLCAGPAYASEQSELMDCFRTVRYYSEGPGQELTNYEKEGRPVLAIAAPLPDKVRFYLYTGDEPYKVEFEDKDYYKTPAMSFAIPEHDTFKCTYRYVVLPGSTADLECKLYDEQTRYKPTTVKKLAYESTSRWPLKSAVLQRMMSVPAVFAKKLKDYSERAAYYHKQKTDPQGLAWVATRMMDWPPKPYPPMRAPYEKVLQGCLKTEDPDVRSGAATSLASLRSLSEPAPIP